MWRRLTGARWAAFCAAVASLVWLVQWRHVLLTHGPTAYNEMKTWGGLTWMDSGKFLVLPFILLIPGVLHVAEAAARRQVRIAAAAVVIALLCSAVTTAMQFWTFEWGSYAETFESKGGVAQLGGFLQAMSSAVMLTIALVVWGVLAARAAVLPYWLTPVMALGSVSTVFLAGPLLPIPALAWILFAGWLASRPRAEAHPDASGRFVAA